MATARRVRQSRSVTARNRRRRRRRRGGGTTKGLVVVFPLEHVMKLRLRRAISNVARKRCCFTLRQGKLTSFSNS